jgi:hypothetical protein
MIAVPSPKSSGHPVPSPKSVTSRKIFPFRGVTPNAALVVQINRMGVIDRLSQGASGKSRFS